ncbi:phosphoglycerate mutase [Catellatospora sp. IY07-71]|uniref:histidine phosphatase family protein n=1 Tax=Catellatospora sp. IY07-71 TaxID=2728827 RepID=UPI001BB42AC8|nr:histidine phosphatase family protein [Catellatospora sp. IY07-71]BCJ74945.1 phosphoglycerate mutase [Catellatospora sp. IY07-71]
MGELLLIRHGETAWSRTGRHAGRTDLPLTEAGEDAARALAPRLAGREFAAVFSSPLARAVRTAELAGLSAAEPDNGLIEWDYGRYEGLTAEEIQELRPGWNLWRDGVDAGEDLGHVTARVDAFLGRVRPLVRGGDVAAVAHGHLTRILTARWLGLGAPAARQFGHPHPGTINVLGHEHGLPVVLGWNMP